MDVTRQDQIDSARDFITNQVGERGLFAVVNNAGVQAVSPIETCPIQLTQSVFNTNVFGALAVTRAFAPLLRAYSKAGARSHLVFISSGVGLYAPPFMNTYAATKHAVESFCDGLRAELRPFGVHVTSIEPGSFKSEIVKAFKAPSTESKQDDSSATSASSSAPSAASTEALYQKRFGTFLQIMASGVSHLPEPTPVNQTLERVLYAKFPPSRALVGVDACALAPLTILLPDTILDGMFRGLEFVSGFLPTSSRKQQ